MRWDQKKLRGSASRSPPVSLLSRESCGVFLVQTEGKVGFAGGWAGGRQVGRAALSEGMLADK